MLDFNESIFDLVGTIEYPYNVELLDGIPKDTAYLYISTTYLNGFVNYPSPKGNGLLLNGSPD